MTGADQPEDAHPTTEATEQGLVVDAGIAPVVERAVALGLTPRASCSGLDHDHAPDVSASPYLSVQVAPTYETAQPTTRLPDDHRDAPLLQRLRAVGDRAGWVVGDGVSWLLYPTITFRLAPTRGDLKNQMFGRDREFDDLSDDEEDRLDHRYDEAKAEEDALSDATIDAYWRDLIAELDREFDGVDLPAFDDNRDEFEVAREEYAPIFEAMFDSEDELPQFLDQ